MCLRILWSLLWSTQSKPLVYSMKQIFFWNIKNNYWQFSGDLLVRIQHFHYHDLGSVPGQGTEIPQAMWQWLLDFLKYLYSSFGGGGLVAKSCPTLATPWTVACQGPLSVGFSRQEYWSGLPFPPPGDLPDPEIEPRSPALQADSLSAELQGKIYSSFIEM